MIYKIQFKNWTFKSSENDQTFIFTNRVLLLLFNLPSIKITCKYNVTNAFAAKVVKKNQ